MVLYRSFPSIFHLFLPGVSGVKDDDDDDDDNFVLQDNEEGINPGFLRKVKKQKKPKKNVVEKQKSAFVKKSFKAIIEEEVASLSSSSLLISFEGRLFAFWFDISKHCVAGFKATKEKVLLRLWSNSLLQVSQMQSVMLLIEMWWNAQRNAMFEVYKITLTLKE